MRFFPTPSSRQPTEGVFRNLAFSDAYAGKTLSVALKAEACKPQDKSCQQPTLYLLRSIDGEIKPAAVIDVIPPAETREWWQNAGLVTNAELVASSREILRWTIEYGQYILYFGTMGPNPTVIQHYGPYPFSANFDITID